MVSYVWVKHEISNISPIGLVQWLSKAMAFWEIFTVFPPKSAICLNCQNKFINLIHYHIVYTVAITTWVSWVSNTPFLGKMPCNTIIIRGTVLGPHVHRVWYVGSVPNCHFSFMSLH